MGETTHRSTSAATWEAIQESGLVSKTRLKVFNFLYTEGPHTQSEINSVLRRGEVNPSYHKRLSELERMGLVRAVRERTCAITGRQCIEWITTDLSVPIPLPKKPPSKKVVAQGLEDLLKELATWLGRQTKEIKPITANNASKKILRNIEDIRLGTSQ